MTVRRFTTVAMLVRFVCFLPVHILREYRHRLLCYFANDFFEDTPSNAFFVVPVLFLAACTTTIEPSTNFKSHNPYMVGWNTSHSELCSQFYAGGNPSYKIKAIKTWYATDRFFNIGYADNKRDLDPNKAPNIDKCDRAVAIVDAEYEGQGVLQSDSVAIREIEATANSGDVVAQNSLGLIYSRGQRVPLDYQAARKWFTMAAEQGFALAQNNLGDMYVNNRFVTANYEEGLKWYRLAASQGNIDAQFSLGRMYYYGQAVEKDYERSLMWYSVASGRGHYGADKLKQRLENKMTKEAIEKAKKLANYCIDNSYKNC